MSLLTNSTWLAVYNGLIHAGGGSKGEDVPRPATVVLDKDGVVRWFSVSRNFQVRPDPGDVLRAVRAL